MNFLASAEAQEIWANRLGKLGTNNKIILLFIQMI